jgi:hypothetical protein
MPANFVGDNAEAGTLTTTSTTGQVRGNKVSIWLVVGSGSSVALQFLDHAGNWDTIKTWTSTPDPSIQVVEDVIVRTWRLNYTHSANSEYSIRAVTDTRG